MPPSVAWVVEECDYKKLKRHEHPSHARMLNFCCFHNQDFLSSERSRIWVTDAIARSRDRYSFKLWAYCIMPNHVHLLIRPVDPVPAVLQSIEQSVTLRALSWTKKNAPEFLPLMLDEQPSGKQSHRFWQRGGGYDRNLWEAEKIWKAIDYIHMNPVKAGLCEGPYDWAWSSARFFTAERAGAVKLDLETIPGRPG